MKEPLTLIKKYTYEFILGLGILAYSLYFSWLTILRYQHLQAHYYDLGIMDQTVYNTAHGRILELTSRYYLENVARMSIHNDILLALLAPFYYIHNSPETLLVLQSVILALGAIPLFLLAKDILKSKLLATVISLSYLLYPAMQRANIYDFHAFTLGTSFILFLWYFLYKKRYIWASIFLLLTLFTKENVGLSTALVGIYYLFDTLRRAVISRRNDEKSHLFNGISNVVRNDKNVRNQIIFSIAIIILSTFWVLISFLYIIPAFRDESGAHFAVERYGDLGNTPAQIAFSILTNPLTYIQTIFKPESLNYIFTLFSHIGFISFFSPLVLIATLPEFAINLLSNSWAMRSIIYHYTSLITPFVFISTIYGTQFLLRRKIKVSFIILVLTIATIGSAYWNGPLLFSRGPVTIPRLSETEQRDIARFEETLADDSIVVMTTGHLAPHFTRRKTFYVFSTRYKAADYILLKLNDLNSYPSKSYNIRIYNEIKESSDFKLIYKNGNFEVYKNVRN